MAELENFLIRPYQKGDNKHPFSCGVTELDRYFRTLLSQDIKRSQAAGYVLWDEANTKVAGYFTISATHIILQQIPEQFQKKLSYNDIPFVLLGRLAIDENYQAQGIGKMLMMSVFELTCKLQQQMGIWGLAVDPINEDAETFYSKFGFQNLSTDKRMFINIQTIKSLF